MDMSHSSHGAPDAPDAPDAPNSPGLDYQMLVALLGVDGVGPPPPAPRAAGDVPLADASAEARLVTVVLGRRGWRGAARSLGGRFASPEGRP